ncbi:MAG: hypothetical protein ACT4QC_21240 [Planctomycetaceae bacterium]
MPVAIADEPRAVRSAHRVRRKAEEAAQMLAQPRDSYQADAQSLIELCIDLSTGWRAIVKEISDSLASKQELDLRGIGEILRPAAEKSLMGYRGTEKLIADAKQHGCTLRDACDVALAIVECENIVRWLNQWPTFDLSQRQRAMAAITDPGCEFATPADFE